MPLFRNPFSNINFEHDILGSRAADGAFQAFDQREGRRQSYYDEAAGSLYVQAGGELGNRIHPVVGWLSRGVGTGVMAGSTSANPFVGVAAGIGALLAGTPDLYKDMQERKRKKKAEQAAAEQARQEQRQYANQMQFQNSVMDAFASFREYNQQQQNTQEALINEAAEIRSVLKELLDKHKAPPKKDAYELEIQRVNEALEKQDESQNPVRAYNNLQIQHLNSFSINNEPALAPRKQNVPRTSTDRYRHRGIASSFFAPAV